MAFDYKIPFPDSIDVIPPVYPLDRKAFDRSLTTGHGRPLVHAMRYGVEAFKDLILDAAIHCRYEQPITEYNPIPPCPTSQEKAIQGWNLAKLCLVAGIADQVLATTMDRHISQIQWNCIEEELVESGYMEAPPEWEEIHSSKTEHWQDIIATQGAQGLMQVAEAFGREDENEYFGCVWQIVDAINYFDTLNGEGSALRLLSGKFSTSRMISRCVRIYRRMRWREKMISRNEEAEKWAHPSSEPTITLEKVMQHIYGDEMKYHDLQRYICSATHEERLSLQRLLHKETDPGVLQRVLVCFLENGLAEFDPSLLALLQHKHPAVREVAKWVFHKHDQPEVREAAFAALVRKKKELALTLLHRSARNGDSDLLLQLLVDLRPKLPDFTDPHEAFILLLMIMRDNQHITEPQLLLFVYEHSCCRVCRQAAVRMLLARDICPDCIKEEGAWDAMPGIREMFAEVMV